MYCEKCGKSNPDGAIFCSNCSSILRSRRASFGEAEKEVKVPAGVVSEPKAKAEENAPKAEISDTMKFASEKKPAPSFEKPAPKKEKMPVIREEDNEEAKVRGSGWCSVLMITSWLIFLSVTLVGVLGGGWMLLYGMTEKISLLLFGGIAVIIVALVLGLAILSRSMVAVAAFKALKNK